VVVVRFLIIEVKKIFFVSLLNWLFLLLFISICENHFMNLFDCTNTLVLKPEPSILKPATGHDPEPVPSTSYPHKQFLYSHINFGLRSGCFSSDFLTNNLYVSLVTPVQDARCWQSPFTCDEDDSFSLKRFPD
jgi:hypothetical protein